MLVEDHSREQFFWDDETLNGLATLCTDWFRVAAVCAPMLAMRLQGEHDQVDLFDIDERFRDLPNYNHWNMARPEPGYGGYSLLVCDPPFGQLSMATVFNGLRSLAGGWEQPLLLTYPVRRKYDVEAVFAPWGVQLTGLRAGYRTVQTLATNPIGWYSNIPEEELAALQL
jgi:hypothetical protein